MTIAVLPDTWMFVNKEKRPRENMNDVLRRVFKELEDLRAEKIKFAERNIIENRIDKILGNDKENEMFGVVGGNNE